MKPSHLLFSLLFPGQQAAAQELPKNYVLLTTSFDGSYLHNPGNGFNASFPYTVTSTTSGVSTTQTITAGSGSFLHTVYSGDIVHFGFVLHHNSIDAGLVGFDKDMKRGTNAYLKAGYGYIFGWGRLQLQPTFDFLLAIDGPVILASIDNTNSNISLLGFTARSQFTEYSIDGDAGSAISETKYANRLKVSYNRTAFLANPGIILGTVTWRRIYIAVEAGWMLQLAQGATIKIVQYDPQQDSNPVGTIHLGRNSTPVLT